MVKSILNFFYFELYKASGFNELNPTSTASRRASRTSLEHGDKSTNNITPDCDRVVSSKVYELVLIVVTTYPRLVRALNMVIRVRTISRQIVIGSSLPAGMSS